MDSKSRDRVVANTAGLPVKFEFRCIGGAEGIQPAAAANYLNFQKFGTKPERPCWIEVGPGSLYHVEPSEQWKDWWAGENAMCTETEARSGRKTFVQLCQEYEFDFGLFDGGEFTSDSEFVSAILNCPTLKYVALDDVSCTKNWANYQRLTALGSGWEVLYQSYAVGIPNMSPRQGWAVLQRTDVATVVAPPKQNELVRKPTLSTLNNTNTRLTETISTISLDFTSTEYRAQPGVCLISMTNPAARSKYMGHILSHICYARRHNFAYTNELFSTTAKSPTYYKIDVVEKWISRKQCRWLWWVDSDVAFVNYNYSIFEHLHPDDHLVMTDHHVALNNGGFLLSTAWPDWKSFVTIWRRANALHYPYTDNGSMMEAIMQVFFPGYRSFSCKKKSIYKCFHHNADAVMGSIRQSVKYRQTNGFKLLRPDLGFNSHPCKNFTCSNFQDTMNSEWGDLHPGWSEQDMYHVPSSLPWNATPMAAVHHKRFHDILAHVPGADPHQTCNLAQWV
jgi:hypothetical protein